MPTPKLYPPDRAPGLIEVIPKTYLAVGVIVAVFVGGISLRSSVKAMFEGDAGAQSAVDKVQDGSLRMLEIEQAAQGVRLQSMERSQAWANDRLYDLASKARLDPPPPPTPSPEPVRPR